MFGSLQKERPINLTSHHYNTRSQTQWLAMESLQEDMTELRATLGNIMNQFMEVIQAMAKGQEELRAAIQRPSVVEAPVQVSGGATDAPNADTGPDPATGQPPSTIGFVPPSGLIFTPPNDIGFAPLNGIGFVPPNDAGSVHSGISLGPHASHIHFTNNQQQPLHHEEPQIPPVRRTIGTPTPHLVDNQEDVFSM